MTNRKVNENELEFESMLGINFSKLDGPKIFESVDGFEHAESNQPGSSLQPALFRKDFRKRVDHLLEVSIADLEDNIGEPTSDSSSSKYDRLFAWASLNGAKIESIKCRKDIYGGRCIVAERDTKEMSVIATLPRSLRIGQNTACKRLGIPSISPDLSALSLFLLDVLLFGSDDNDDVRCDNFHHYVACLPRRCANALFMSESELNKWSNQGGDYKEAIARVQSQGESCMQYIQNCLSSRNNNNSISCLSKDLALCWAVSMVQSRSHGFGTTRSRWLTPIFDFCNHSTEPNCTVEGDAYGQLVLKTTRCITAGEELTIDYMEPDDAKLVATYGFSAD